MKRKVFQLLVDNTSGVLTRISGLFARRGYNIDSFSANVTSDPRITRITIVTSGDELILEQIEKQIAKLCDVINVTELEPGDSVTRELMLVKIAVTAERRQEVLSLITVFKGKVVDVTHDTMVIEVTGHTGKLESVLDMISDYEILELARTGITGLKRGGKAYNPPAEQEL